MNAVSPGEKARPAAEEDTDAFAARLAAVLIDAGISQPLSALLPPPLLARLVREAALFYLRSPLANELSQKLMAEAQRFLKAQGSKSLRELLPREAVALLRKLVMQPYTPNRALLVAALSREPFRRLNRELMIGTLLDYSRRLRTTVTDGGMGKGLGALSRLASEAVKKSTSALGTLAPGVTSAVSDEFERQMQRRAAEFADGAVDEMVQRVATTLTDAARAAEHTELKLALLDFTLELRASDLLRELERARPTDLEKEVRQVALLFLEREQATAELTAALFWLLSQLGAPFFAAPPEPVRAALQALLGHTLRPLVPIIKSGTLLSASSGNGDGTPAATAATAATD